MEIKIKPKVFMKIDYVVGDFNNPKTHSRLSALVESKDAKTAARAIYSHHHDMKDPQIHLFMNVLKVEYFEVAMCLRTPEVVLSQTDPELSDPTSSSGLAPFKSEDSDSSTPS